MDALLWKTAVDRATLIFKFAQKRKAKQQIFVFRHHEVPGRNVEFIYAASRKKTEEILNGLSHL